MKNVLYYTSSLASGGAERQLIYTAISAREKGYNVLIVVDYPINHYTNMLNGKKVDIICTNSTKFNPIRRFLVLARVIKEFQPDIVHSFLGTKNLWAMAVARVYRVPVRVASIRNTGKTEFIGMKFYQKWADRILCNSECALEIAKSKYGVPDSKLEVVYNAIDLKSFQEAVPSYGLKDQLGIPAKTILGVTVARFAEQKNHMGLIRALKILLDRGKLDGVHYLLVGNPSDQKLFNQVMSEVERLGLSSKISYLGVRNDIPEILKACDFMVLASFYEGFPNVILEAMASGVFVIATPTGGTPELVADGDNGLLTKGTSPMELASSIQQYIEMSHGDRESIKASALKTVVNFDMGHNFSQIEKFYAKDSIL